jgi:hypothetical protein
MYFLMFAEFFRFFSDFFADFFRADVFRTLAEFLPLPSFSTREHSSLGCVTLGAHPRGVFPLSHL